MKEFLTRTLFGAIYAAVVIGSILVDSSLFGVVFMIVTALAVKEYHNLVQSSVKQTASAMAASVLLFAFVFFSYLGTSLANPLLFGYFVVMIIAMLQEVIRPNNQTISNWGHLCGSQLMIALPFSLMTAVLMHDKFLLLALFILVWANDSGAYLLGSITARRKNGNHKMCPAISPKKSWEGLVGGIILSVAAVCVFHKVGWISSISLTTYPWLNSILLAMVVSIFSTLGDLMESQMKRTLGVKDSGKFMPGHGGVLDRFDSLLLVVPVVYFLFVYLPSIL
jgi:phosphatidate cytidylyltransferase